MPLVSVIVPVYNIAPYIERCVDSVLAQTYSNWELILVDDGSTDGSAQVCDEQLVRDSRIKVIHQQNAGVTIARKVGVQSAQGEWIMFIDGDDDIVSTAIEYLLSFDITRYEIIGATYTRIVLGKVYNLHFKAKGEMSSEDYIEALLLDQTYIGPCAKLIKKQLFDNFNWDVPKYVIQNEDLLMLVYLASKAKQIYVSEQSVYNYYCRDNSVSQSQTMSLDGWKYIFIALQDLLVLYKSERIKYAYFHYRLVRLYLYVIRKKIFISIDDEQVLQLTNDSKLFSLSKDEKYWLSLLINKFSREKYYIISSIKSVCHKILDHLS